MENVSIILINGFCSTWALNTYTKLERSTNKYFRSTTNPLYKIPSSWEYIPRKRKRTQCGICSVP